MSPDDKITCPVYGVENRAYACAVRHRNANTPNVYEAGGPGCGDLACRDCETGRLMLAAGLDKRRPVKQEDIVMVKEEKAAEKTCSKCKRSLPMLTSFHKNKSTKDGLEHWCKECKNAAFRARAAGKRAKKIKVVSDCPEKEMQAAEERARKAVAVEVFACLTPPGAGVRDCRDSGAAYYDHGGLSTLEVIRAKLTDEQFKGFLLGNCIKYSCRLNYKGDSARDAEKGAMYAAWLSEEMGRCKR